MTPTSAFAERADDAFRGPETLVARARALTRSAALTIAAAYHRPRPDFVRCLYSHAVFPEHARKFREVLRALKSQGDFIDSSELTRIMSTNRAPKGCYFHLSFDDGFANVFDVGCDALLAENIQAVIFIVSHFPNANERELAQDFRLLHAYRRPVRVMTWGQVRAARGAGLEIGSHTRSHPRLSQLEGDSQRLRAEIIGSRADIEMHIGGPCKVFAWPFGRMSDIGVEGTRILAAAGYDLAFSAVRGRIAPNTSRFAVPRHQIEFHWPASHIRLWAGGFRER